MNRFLTVRKSLLSGASIAIIALAVPTVAPWRRLAPFPPTRSSWMGAVFRWRVVRGGAGGAWLRMSPAAPPPG